MGGQQAYYWAVMHGSNNNPNSPPFLKRAIVICGSAKTSGHNYAFLEGPTSALLASHDYVQGRLNRSSNNDNKNNNNQQQQQQQKNGLVVDHNPPKEGLRAFGRAYAAWLTSAEWFRQELWREVGANSLHDWLYPPVASAESWDPEDLITLARMWQAGDVGDVFDAAAQCGSGERGGGDYKKALASISAKVLLMPCMTDQYFVAEDCANEVKFLQKGKYEPIPSVWGHIAGGGANPKDTEWMDGKIAEFMKED